MTRRVAWMALGVALLAGCRQENTGVSEDYGHDLYMTRCAVCHGANGEGRAGLYPALAGSQWVDGQPDRLAAIILDGLQGQVGNYNAVMPGWGSVMPDTEIAAVMTWLRKGDGKGPVTAVDVNHVRVVTVGRNTFWTVEDLRNLPGR
jgi:mono/diheme cytochrome c family protein